VLIIGPEENKDDYSRISMFCFVNYVELVIDFHLRIIQFCLPGKNTREYSVWINCFLFTLIRNETWKIFSTEREKSFG